MLNLHLIFNIFFDILLMQCRCGSMVEYDLAKVETGVRFSSLAPFVNNVGLEIVRFFYAINSRLYPWLFLKSIIFSRIKFHLMHTKYLSWSFKKSPLIFLFLGPIVQQNQFRFDIHSSYICSFLNKKGIIEVNPK